MAAAEEEEEAAEDEDEDEDADAEEEEEEEEEAGEADLRRLAAGAGRRGIGECVCGGYVRGLGDEDVCVCGGVWGVVWCGRKGKLV